jgi:hypothetical protein
MECIPVQDNWTKSSVSCTIKSSPIKNEEDRPPNDAFTSFDGG